MNAETVLGVLPENVVPLEPGETSATDDKHMRNRKEGGLLCGAADGSPVARAWVNVTCVDCLEKRSRTAETTTEKKPKTKAKATKKKKSVQPPDVEVVGPDDEVNLNALICLGVNNGLFHLGRGPAPPRELESFSGQVIRALEHYSVLLEAAHPLSGVVISAVYLGLAIKAAPILDEKTLHLVHGRPYYGEA